MDINELIYDTLTPLNIPVDFEEGDYTSIPDEYVVFNRIYGDERNFVDGQALYNYHLYRINYFGTDKEKREIAMHDIKAKMKEAGFFLQTDSEPIPREKHATHWGAFSEFTYWESLDSTKEGVGNG